LVIGLGALSKGMAAAEHPVTVWNRTGSAADELALRGTRRPASPAEAASRTPMPLATLLRDRFLAAIAEGRGGIDRTALAAEDAGLQGERTDADGRSTLPCPDLIHGCPVERRLIGPNASPRPRFDGSQACRDINLGLAFVS
jgi:hypothetical protein